MNLYRTSLNFRQYSTFCLTAADAAKYLPDGSTVAEISPHPACLRRILRLSGSPSDCLRQAWAYAGSTPEEARAELRAYKYSSCGDLPDDALGSYILRRLSERWDWLVFMDRISEDEVWMRLTSDKLFVDGAVGDATPVVDEGF